MGAGREARTFGGTLKMWDGMPGASNQTWWLEANPKAGLPPASKLVHPKTLLMSNGCCFFIMCQAAFAHFEASALVATAADPVAAFLRW